MDSRTFPINVNGYSGTVDRVNKTTARQAYENDQPVFLLGVNLSIGMMFQPCPVKRDKPTTSDQYMIYDKTFNKTVDNFVYYNCDSERGYYPAFYLLRP